jgi:hypothetical protein
VNEVAATVFTRQKRSARTPVWKEAPAAETMRLEPAFSSRSAAQLSGLSGGQLHAWSAAEVAVPSIDPGYRQGRPKKWAFTDVVGLRILRELMEAGLPIVMLSNVIPSLRAYTLERPNRQSLTAARIVLYGNGDVQITDDEERVGQLVAVSAGTMLRALVIDVAPAVIDVEKAMRRLQMDEDLDRFYGANKFYTAA